MSEERMSPSMLARRRLLMNSSYGIGTAGLWSLLQSETNASDHNSGLFAAGPCHIAPRAKNVIFLFMMGGPSHVDLLDPKPKMSEWHGIPMPASLVAARKSATGGILETVLATRHRFRPRGRCGMQISDLLPHISRVADRLCLVRSMHCEQSNHDPAQLLLHCGTPLFGSPSMGSWITYGLGSLSQNMPGYLVLLSDDGHGLEGAGSSLWGSGYMPSSFRGVTFRRSGDPILHLQTPSALTREMQRSRIDAIRDLNRLTYQRTGDQEVSSRIDAYEMAFRMQTAAPELLSVSDETAATQAAYGLHQEQTRPFGMNCLLARRMVERGVRFVHLIHSSWDHHSELNRRLALNCEMTDQPCAALIEDLEQRGLLDETLVVWAGEFGRTPMSEVRRGVMAGIEGRDHHPDAFSIWMAGGGVKPGYVHGTTDDFGFRVTSGATHIHDLQATILHLLGIDHEQLTYRHSGRDFRLTDVAGSVIHQLLT
ncbi:MAG: DUF1501 domain-containing protein [Planctomycetota bacterium]